MESSYIIKIINGLNLSIGAIEMYPDFHPIVTNSINRLMKDFMKLEEDLNLKISRNTLTFKDKKFQEGGAREFAERLRKRGVQAITFERGVKEEDIKRFLKIIILQPHELRKKGIDKVLDEEGISKIKVLKIDYAKIFELPVVPDALIEIMAFITGEKDILSIDEFEVLRELFNNPKKAGEVIGRIDVPSCLTFLERIENFVPHEKLSSFIYHLPSGKRFRLMKEVAEKGGKVKEILQRFSDEEITSILISSFEEEGIEEVFRVLLPDEKRRRRIISLLHERITKAYSSSSVIRWKEIKKRLTEREDVEVLSKEREKELGLLAEGVSEVEERELKKEVSEDLKGKDLQYDYIWVLLDLFSFTKDVKVGKEIAEVLKDFVTSSEFDLVIKALEIFRATEYLTKEREKDLFRSLILQFKISDKEKREKVGKILSLLGEDGVSTLIDLLAEEREREVRRFLINTLAQIGESTIPKLRERLKDSPWYVTRNMLTILASVGDESIMPDLPPLLHHEDFRVRRELARVLGRLKDKDSFQLLLKLLKDKDIEVRQSSIIALSQRGEEGIPHLLRIARKRDIFGRNTEEIKEAIKALGRLKVERAVPFLKRLLKKRWIKEEIKECAKVALRDLEVEIEGKTS
ncbi:MAG: HEAT repeat domain-containing protein [bacterium]|nr:HEAT repeat domain-containing protein [bacterium]